MHTTRQSYTFSIQESNVFKSDILSYFKNESHLVLLDSNQAVELGQSCLIAIGAKQLLSCDVGDAFNQLELFQEAHKDWMFGYLSYDLKNELELLESQNPDLLEFPDLQFFVPQLVIEVKESTVIFHSYDTLESVNKLWQSITKQEKKEVPNQRQYAVLEAKDTREEYLQKAHRFLKHIQRGDIYEANLCTQFFARNVEIDPVEVFQHLNQKSQSPFAAYVRMDDHFAISASPERYLKKIGKQLLSQPIKGTAPRSQDQHVDAKLKKNLLGNQKERSENVMIVDLVRNDLARVAAKGSVQVTELFGLHTFPQVHHMISSISAILDEGRNGIDAIMATFPMGSMTGAPKVSAMRIIEEQESFKRGIYSGAIGYFTPTGDFDFNVVIRTILYNQQRQIVSLSVGSAITAAADPEQEYEECLVKAKALIETLATQGIDYP